MPDREGLGGTPNEQFVDTQTLLAGLENAIGRGKSVCAERAWIAGLRA
jgi:hypothetical protein